MRSLSDADIEMLCVGDNKVLRAGTQLTEATVESIELTVLPTADLVRYQHVLADYMSNIWHSEAPENRGATYKDQAWSYGFHDFRN